MKRFWKEVSVSPEGDFWGIALDGRAVRTPARAPLAVPGEALAQAVADEWRRVEATLDPRAMPLTGLANAAIDRVAPDRASFAQGVARYAEADLLCYRAGSPDELAARQAASWYGLLDWARRRYDIEFATTAGLVHVAQPPATLERLGRAVAACDPFRLAGLSPLVTIGGSLVAALAVLEQAISGEDAWQTVSIDECWQLERWGADREAEHALEARRGDFLAAAQFLALLGR